MQIVPLPLLDRARVRAMIPGQKISLNGAWPSDPATASALVATFFGSLSAIAREHLDSPVALLLDFCTLRHNQPGAMGPAPWHTDARFFPPAGDGLTFWCPLDAVGDTAPGVTFRVAEGEVTPRLGPGQALVIPPTLEHRTQDIEGERISIEFRCAPAERLPCNLGASPTARRVRRRDGVEGILLEAEGRPFHFLNLQTAST